MWCVGEDRDDVRRGRWMDCGDVRRKRLVDGSDVRKGRWVDRGDVRRKRGWIKVM